jgi:hypothetical protein
MTRRLAIVAMAFAIPLLTADAAVACSCVPLKPRAALKGSDGAFVGRLVAVREVDPPAEGEPSGSGLHRGRRVAVRSVRDEASCGLPDFPGELFGLFVYRRNHRWHGNLCLTTTPRRLRRAAEGSSASRAGSPGSAACG